MVSRFAIVASEEIIQIIIIILFFVVYAISLF